MAGHARYTALLDACVLYPMAMTDALMSVAATGLFAAKWTRRIEVEWTRALQERRPDLKGRLDYRRDQMRDAIPDWEVEERAWLPVAKGLALPDPARCSRAGCGARRSRGLHRHRQSEGLPIRNHRSSWRGSASSRSVPARAVGSGPARRSGCIQDGANNPLGIPRAAAFSSASFRTNAQRARPHYRMSYDTAKVEEAVLALLGVFEFKDGRVWKRFDFEVMDALHDKGYITNPRGRHESVYLTAQGMELAKRLARERFDLAAAPRQERRSDPTDRRA